MVTRTTVVPHAAVPHRTGTKFASDGPEARRPSSPSSRTLTLAEFEQRLRCDRRALTRLASDPERLRAVAARLLESDGRAFEMFADDETLVAYLRVLIEESLRRPALQRRAS